MSKFDDCMAAYKKQLELADTAFRVQLYRVDEYSEFSNFNVIMEGQEEDYPETVAHTDNTEVLVSNDDDDDESDDDMSHGMRSVWSSGGLSLIQ